MPSPKPSADSYRTIYPQTCKAVGEARRKVVGFARNCGFAGRSLDDIEIAVGEALANAYEHGAGGPAGFEVNVRCEVDAVTIEVSDSGGGFEHWNNRQHVRPSTEAVRGFGTFIMRELMDEVEYSQRGTRLRLVKRHNPNAWAQWSALLG